MRNKLFMLGVLALILASTALAYVPTQKINFQNCSDPQRLERLLNDQFSALKDDISGLYFSGTGNFFYVDSNVGSASYTGTDWVHPKATLDSAVALCTANNGDVIFVASGHAESLSAANGVDLDVAGITVIGLGNDADRPTFSYTNAAGEIVIGAANVSLYNIRMIPAVTAVLKAIDIETSGDNCLIEGCEFVESATAADEFLSCIIVNGAAAYAGCNDVHIIGNKFFSYDDGATGSAITSIAGIVNGLTIQNNLFIGDWDEACILSDDININVLVEGNIATNLDTGQYAIEFSAASTGICANNLCSSDVYTNVLDPGSLMCFGNLGVLGVDATAFPIPTNAYSQASGVMESLSGAAGLVAWPTASVYGNGKSFAEAIAFISEAVNAGTGGDALGSNKSLVDAIGSDGAALVDGAVSIAGIIGIPTDADNLADSSTIVAGGNRDGSLFERSEYEISMSAKSISKTVSTIANGANNLFAVSGGPIKIVEIVTYVTTTPIAAEGCLVGYNIDPTTPATDTAFGTDGTALECNNAAVGTILTWAGVLAADLLLNANGCSLGLTTDSGLIVPIGMIELTAAHDGACTGEFTTYMRYVPLSPLSVVTAQ